jgi:hypothetical protein
MVATGSPYEEINSICSRTVLNIFSVVSVSIHIIGTANIPLVVGKSEYASRIAVTKITIIVITGFGSETYIKMIYSL